jgi:hypothetical protein
MQSFDILRFVALIWATDKDQGKAAESVLDFHYVLFISCL